MKEIKTIALRSSTMYPDGRHQIVIEINSDQINILQDSMEFLAKKLNCKINKPYDTY